MKNIKDIEIALKKTVLTYLSNQTEEFEKALDHLNNIELKSKKGLTSKYEIAALSQAENIEVLAKKATSAYRLLTVYLSKEYEEERRSKELQFNESKKRMGRPVLSIEELAERAKEQYDFYLDYMKELAKKHDIEPASEIQIQKKAARTTRGRKRKDEVLALMKYIRSCKRKVKVAEAMSEDVKMPKGKGRKPKSKAATIEHYRKILNEAEEELSKSLLNKTAYELLYYKLYETRNDKREAKKQNNAERLKEIETEISEIEADMRVLNGDKKSRSLTIDKREIILEKKQAYMKKEEERLNKQRTISQEKLKKAKEEEDSSQVERKRAY